MQVTIKDLKLGGQPVVFDQATGCLSLAGEEVPLAQWLETRRRIDLLMKRGLTEAGWKALREQLAWLGKRDRLPQELRDHETPPAPPASGFLTHNLEAINRLKAGTLKVPPFWLRWLYGAVVTKDGLG